MLDEIREELIPQQEGWVNPVIINGSQVSINYINDPNLVNKIAGKNELNSESVEQPNTGDDAIQSLHLSAAVVVMGQAMDEQLIANTTKGGWNTCPNKELAQKLTKNVNEFLKMTLTDNPDPSQIRKTGADCANYIMMLMDNNKAFLTNKK